jgi:hypothetical protein
MSRLTQKGQGAPLDIFSTSSDAGLATLTGAKFDSVDGREFVLVQVGAAAIASGLLVQAPASIGANHTGLAVVANAAIGATSISVTNGGTVTTKNQYAGGFAVISAGTGIGQTLRIAGNTAGTSSGTTVLTLEDPLKVAIASSDSKVSLTLNPFGSAYGTAYTTHGVIVSPTTASGAVIGVTVNPLPASTASVLSYGLIQTKGLVACLNDSATAIGLDVMPSSSVAGAVVTYVVATRSRVGTSTVAGENTKAQLIMLQL